MRTHDVKKIAVLLIVLLMAGCAPSEPVSVKTSSPDTAPSKPFSIETDSPDATPSGPVSVETSSPDTAPSKPFNIETDSPDAAPSEPDNSDRNNEEKNDYYELKTEFEREIELKVQGTYVGYAWGIFEAFEEMLQHRQSLEDVNEEMGRFYSEQYDDFRMTVDVTAIFTYGKINYRILLFSAWYLPLDRMYIQIYDDEYFESRCINEYIHEGGIYQIMLYCGFIQDTDKNYLVIINKEYNDAVDIVNYYLVNYEVDGKDINNYAALKQDVSKGMWKVNGIFNDYYEMASTKISYSNAYDKFGLEYWGEMDYDSQESFEDNVFTVIGTFLYQDNELEDEISLLFMDGFWEVMALE